MRLLLVAIWVLTYIQITGQVGIGTAMPTAGLDLESTLSLTYLLDQDFETESIDPFETNGDALWFIQSAFTPDANSDFALRSGAINAAQKSTLSLLIEAPANKETFFAIQIYYEVTEFGIINIDDQVIEGPAAAGWYTYSKEMSPGLNKVDIVLRGNGDAQKNPGLIVVDNARALHFDNFALRVADGNEGENRILFGDKYGNATWVENNFIRSGDNRATITPLNFRIDFDGTNLVQVLSDEFNVNTQDNRFGSIVDFFGNVSWGENNTIHPFVNQNSTAWGNGNTSNNRNATSWGDGNEASGENSTSWGNDNVSSGINCTSWGMGNTAGGNSSTAFGFNNDALNIAATAIGSANSATGNFSVAMGQNNGSTGAVSITMGIGNVASGLSGIALGSQNSAVADRSLSLGNNVRSQSYKQVTLGSYNKDFDLYDPSQWIATDPLFVLGNGENSASRSNAMMVLKNGFVGLGDIEPQFTLHLPNDATTGTARAHTWSTYSDRRIKSDVNELDYGLEDIMHLRPVSYRQHSAKFENGDVILKDKGIVTIGLIAQEVHEVIPEAVMTPRDDSKELWGMEYEKIIPVLIRSVQELKRSNDELKKEIDTLKRQMSPPLQVQMYSSKQ